MSPCYGAHSSSMLDKLKADLETCEVVDTVATINCLGMIVVTSERDHSLVEMENQSSPGIGMSKRKSTRVHLIKVPDLDPPRLSHLAINLRFEAIPSKDVQ